MKESKYERRRRRLVLREARLSNVTERYTEETAPLEELRAPHGSPPRGASVDAPMVRVRVRVRAHLSLAAVRVGVGVMVRVKVRVRVMVRARFRVSVMGHG